MQVYHYDMNFSKQLLVNFCQYSTTTKEHASRFLKCTCIFISGLNYYVFCTGVMHR